MFHMARNRHIVALFHAHELSLFELQGRFPPHHDDPLVLILIVPKPGGLLWNRETIRWILMDGVSNKFSDCSDPESSGRFANKFSTRMVTSPLGVCRLL